MDEWCALPWWQQRLYIGELERDAPWKQSAPVAAAPAAERPAAKPITVPRDVANPEMARAASALASDPFSADLGAFAQLGMRTRRAAPSAEGRVI